MYRYAIVPIATGRLRSVATEPTSAAHENAGTRSRVMPGARDVRTVVATHKLAAKIPAAVTATPSR